MLHTKKKIIYDTIRNPKCLSQRQIICQPSHVTCHLSPACQEPSRKLKLLGSKGSMVTKLKQ